MNWTLCFPQKTLLWFVGFFGQVYLKVFFCSCILQRESGHWSRGVDGDTSQTFSAKSGYTTGCIWICWHFQLYEVGVIFPDLIDPNTMAACCLLDADMTTGEATCNSLYGHDLSKKPEHPTKNPLHIPKPNLYFGGGFNLHCFSSLVYGMTACIGLAVPSGKGTSIIFTSK